MDLITVPVKATGDTFSASEVNDIVSKANAAISQVNENTEDIETINEALGAKANASEVSAALAAKANAASLTSKVDKVNGKGLSTNDFTNEYKTQLDELEGGGGGTSSEDAEVATQDIVSLYPNGLTDLEANDGNNDGEIDSFRYLGDYDDTVHVGIVLPEITSGASEVHIWGDAETHTPLQIGTSDPVGLDIDNVGEEVQVLHVNNTLSNDAIAYLLVIGNSSAYMRTKDDNYVDHYSRFFVPIFASTCPAVALYPGYSEVRLRRVQKTANTSIVLIDVANYDFGGALPPLSERLL